MSFIRGMKDKKQKYKAENVLRKVDEGQKAEVQG